MVRDDIRNAALRTVVVCPLTSARRPHWRTRLQVSCAGRPADVGAHQIRVMSQTRLGEKLGCLSADEAAALRELLTGMYGEP